MRYRNDIFEKIVTSRDGAIKEEREFLLEKMRFFLEIDFELNRKIGLLVFKYLICLDGYELTQFICYEIGISESTFRRLITQFNKLIFIISNKYNLLLIKKIWCENSI